MLSIHTMSNVKDELDFCIYLFYTHVFSKRKLLLLEGLPKCLGPAHTLLENQNTPMATQPNLTLLHVFIYSKLVHNYQMDGRHEIWTWSKNQFRAVVVNSCENSNISKV